MSDSPPPILGGGDVVGSEEDDEGTTESEAYLTPELSERCVAEDRRKRRMELMISCSVSTEDEECYFSSVESHPCLPPVEKSSDMGSGSNGHPDESTARSSDVSPCRRRQMAAENDGAIFDDETEEGCGELGAGVRRAGSSIKKKKNTRANSFSSEQSRKFQEEGIDVSSVNVDALQQHITLTRPAYTVSQLRHDLSYQPPPTQDVCSSLTQRVSNSCKCSMEGFLNLLFKRIPFLSLFGSYSPRRDLASDLIAGMTVAIMHVPQGMAYAMLAEVPPIVGLYTAFFPVLAYAIFGTSRHVSVGTFAVACLMTGKVVGELSTTNQHHVVDSTTSAGSLITNETAAYDDYVIESPGGASLLEEIVPTSLFDRVDVNGSAVGGAVGAAMSDPATVHTPIEVAVAVSLVVGLWQVFFGLLQLGQVCVFLSDMLISGFTTGAACHVLSSQIKHILGIPVKRYSGPFRLIYTYIDVFTMITDVNVAAVVMSVICITVLVINNEVIKPRVKQCCNFPIPIELIVVILGTIAAYFFDFEQSQNLRVVGQIPTGLPAPTPAKSDLISKVLLDSLVIAIVVYTISFSMAKIFSKKHRYTVDATQELYAQGISNIFGSLFSCVPSAVSLSRSLIQESVGCRTQVTSFVSCTAILFIVLFVGPLFKTLPTCVLASIIVVALKGMFLQVNDFLNIWKKSKLEAMLWLVPFLTVVLIDIDYGLIVGFAVSLLLIIFRSQSPDVKILGWLPGTDIYVDLDTYHSAVTLPSVSLCQVTGALHFANCDSFRTKLVNAIGTDPQKDRASRACSRASSIKSERGVRRPAAVAVTIDEAPPSSSQVTTVEGRKGSASSNLTKKVLKQNIVGFFKRKPSLNNTSEDGPKTGSAKLEGSHNLSYVEDEPEFKDVSTAIINISGVGWVDVSAGKQLASLYAEYTKNGVDMAFAGVNDAVLSVLRDSGASSVIPENRIFFSLHDAVTSLVAPEGEDFGQCFPMPTIAEGSSHFRPAAVYQTLQPLGKTRYNDGDRLQSRKLDDSDGAAADGLAATHGPVNVTSSSRL